MASFNGKIASCTGKLPEKNGDLWKADENVMKVGVEKNGCSHDDDRKVRI
jgi:hypothetical protein